MPFLATFATNALPSMVNLDEAAALTDNHGEFAIHSVLLSREATQVAIVLTE